MASQLPERGLPERHRDRLGRQRVQPLTLGGQQLGRRAAGDPVRPGVDHAAEPRAGGLELGKRPVVLAQVDLGGDQVPLGDAHGGLRAALGLRVGRHAGPDRQPVVPTGGHDVGVADRHPRHVLHGDGLLVVGQRVGRHPAEPPQRGVQAAKHAGQRPVPRGQHHPEPRPRQPRAPQPRLPAADLRAGAPVELQPQPRLGHPRTEHPPVPSPPAALDRRDRPPGGPLRPRVAHRGQLGLGDVRADAPLRALHPLLQLRQPGVDQLLAAGPLVRATPGVPQPHVPRHRVVVATDQLRRGAEAAGQVVGLQDLHDLLAVLHPTPCSARRRRATASQARRLPRSTPGSNTVTNLGRSPGRHRGETTAASGEVHGRHRGASRGRRHTVRVW